MKLTAKEREAIEKAGRFIKRDMTDREQAMYDQTFPMYGPVRATSVALYAMGYLAGQRDAKKGKGKK